MSKTRLIIVEDHPLFRKLLAMTLAAETELEVVGVAENLM
jgi:DNA-binding NarL/FixJ family response regulator